MVSDLSLRPRSATEIVDAAFRLYRQHFVSIVTVSALVYIPAFVLSLALTHYQTGAGSDGPGAALGMVVALIGLLLWYPVLWAALLVAASDAYLGHGVDAGRAVATALRRFAAVVLSSIAKGFLIGLGLLFLLIPSLYFLARYFAVPAAAVLENRGAGGTMSRSSELAAGEKGRILAALVLVWLLYIVLSTAAAFAAIAFSSSSIDEPSMTVQIASAVISILAIPLVTNVEVLLYYDIRIRREGFDIEMMTGQLAATPSLAR